MFASVFCCSLQTVILDGKSGNKLWSLNTTQPEFSSPIVLRTKTNNRDVFLFRVQGLDGKATSSDKDKDAASADQKKRTVRTQ